MVAKKKRMYLDYASATPVLAASTRAMARASGAFANPGSIHRDGVAAHRVVEAAREAVAKNMACKAREVIFVSGGTEANNLAILGFARKLESVRRTLQGSHWIVSALEHPSVLDCFSEVERLGGEVTHLQPDSSGRISPLSVERALTKETVFVSVGWANHEIGIIQNISGISRAIRAHERETASVVAFHCDAGQAPLYISPYVHTLGVDLFSLDSGKMYGPRGIGALYVSNRTELSRIMFGGGQERGLRAGTENVTLAVGFAAAFDVVSSERLGEKKRLKKIRDDAFVAIQKGMPECVINTDLKNSLPHMLNISIPRVDCEYLTLLLDKEGVSVATKSACREGEESVSHIVAALGGDAWRSRNTIRISLGRDTRKKDIDFVIEALVESIKSQAASGK
jgi:cysteine desulfurase